VAIAGGVQLFYLDRIMADSEDYLRGLLDAYDDNAATG
jgi:hypothetical protein